jgi:hypothetical protein
MARGGGAFGLRELLSELGFVPFRGIISHI